MYGPVPLYQSGPVQRRLNNTTLDCPGHCGCGQPFDHYTDWAQHAQTAGCRHWRLDRPIPRENPAA